MKKKNGTQNARYYVTQPASHLRPKVAALAVAACFSSVVLANPTAPTVVHGTASFAQAGNILNVTNSHNAIINWGSFSIGVNELTKFIQPSALSAVLNRVVGQDPSAILGALQSNGRVFLINPNGILFGAGSQINVAGLVASTLNMSNADFLAGRMNFTDGAGAGSVVNQGSINASGGPVYMVGNAVTNNGIITSPGGEVVLAAGNSVELVNPGTPNLRVEIQAGDNEARNLGSVVADAGRIGIYAGLIKQGGVLNADSAVAEGGRIMLKSSKSTVLETGSAISAHGSNGGKIEVFSGMTDGRVAVAGSLDASATGSTGQGGFVETSAAEVGIDASTRVYTGGAAASGRWVIDPAGFTISAGAAPQTSSGIGADTLVANLATTPMDIFTTTAGDNIDVDAAVSWNSGNYLKLTAHNDITVSAPITNAGTGAIHLTAGWDGISTLAPAVVAGVGNISLDAPVSTAGVVHLIAGADINQTASSIVSASQLLVKSEGGNVFLIEPNMVGTLAGSSADYFRFKNGQSLVVGSVGGVNGVTATGSNAKIEIEANTGNLTINQPVRALGSGSGGQAEVNLQALNGTLAINQAVEAKGSDGDFGDSGGSASVTLNGGVVNIAAPVSATGGHALGIGIEDFAEGGNAAVNVDGSNSISVTSAGSITAIAGNSGNDEYGTSSGGDANVNLTSSGALEISGAIVSKGGHGGNGVYGENVSDVAGSDGGYGYVYADVGSFTLTSTGSIAVTGGDGGNGVGSSYYGTGGAGGYAQIYADVRGPILIAGSITGLGGTGGTGVSGGQGGYSNLTLTNYDFTGGTITVDSTGSIGITGGSGGQGGLSGGSYGGNANISLYSDSATTVNGNMTATGGAGVVGPEGLEYTWGGGEASIYLSAYGSSASVTIANNATVSAIGQAGPDGGEGYVSLYAPYGTINTSTGIVTARGGGNNYYLVAEVNAYAGGDITLGQMNADDLVYVYTYGGQIIDGNTGVNILAPRAQLYGYGGVGSITNPLETVVTELRVNSNNGDIGIINTGNLLLYGYNAFYAPNGNVAIGTTGSLTVDGAEGYAGGDLSLLANGDINIIGYDGNVRAGGNLLLNAGGNLNIGGAGGYNNYAYGNTNTVAVAGGNLNVQAGDYYYYYYGPPASTLGSFSSNTTVKTGGNVVVDNSSIRGGPDVMMQVGGAVFVNGTLSNPGRIEAGSVNTITLVLTGLTGGGFSVNGVSGAVYDALTDTGFLTNGNPAVLGETMMVTYTGASISPPTDTLIVAMNQATKPPEDQKSTGAMESEDEKNKDKKKDLPICGK